MVNVTAIIISLITYNHQFCNLAERNREKRELEGGIWSISTLPYISNINSIFVTSDK